MIIIDFLSTPKKAFEQGFLKGLGAPFMLFGGFESSARIPEVQPVKPASHERGLPGDWERIGQDLRAAFKRHEQETPRGK